MNCADADDPIAANANSAAIMILGLMFNLQYARQEL
jgi:hypothetical protein